MITIYRAINRLSLDSSVFFLSLIVLVSLSYGSVLAWIIPVDGTIIDRANYIDYAERSQWLLSRYFSGGLLSLLANEPVWLVINVFLRRFLEATEVVRVIVFFSAFTTSFLVLKSNPKYFVFLILILLFPQVIGKFVVHLRQGLAISFFLMGWFSNKPKVRWFFLLLSPFIHVSFLFVLLLYLITQTSVKLRLAFDVQLLVIALVAFTVIISLPFLASLLGARQANEYSFTRADVSGLGFIYWSSVFFLFWAQGRLFLQKHFFVVGCLMFYLFTYFFLEVTARIFESVVILVLLSGLELKAQKRMLFSASFLLLFTALWWVRSSEPYLGWGV